MRRVSLEGVGLSSLNPRLVAKMLGLFGGGLSKASEKLKDRGAKQPHYGKSPIAVRVHHNRVSMFEYRPIYDAERRSLSKLASGMYDSGDWQTKLAYELGGVLG